MEPEIKKMEIGIYSLDSARKAATPDSSSKRTNRKKTSGKRRKTPEGQV